MTAGRPEPVPFSLTLQRQSYEGTIAVRPYVGGPPLVAVDVAIGASHVASIALGEEAAIDLAVRLIAAVVRRRGDQP
jgi:hypothetical protein